VVMHMDFARACLSLFDEFGGKDSKVYGVDF
jgi:hypothetical protein